MKAIFTLALITLFAFTVQAQQKESPKKKQTKEVQKFSTHDKKMESLTKELKMDDTQKANVSKTIKAFDQRISEINTSNLSADEKKKRLTKIVTQKEKNIESYLSKEQFSSYKKLNTTSNL